MTRAGGLPAPHKFGRQLAENLIRSHLPIKAGGDYPNGSKVRFRAAFDAHQGLALKLARIDQRDDGLTTGVFDWGLARTKDNLFVRSALENVRYRYYDFAQVGWRLTVFLEPGLDRVARFDFKHTLDGALAAAIEMEGYSVADFNRLYSPRKADDRHALRLLCDGMISQTLRVLLRDTPQASHLLPVKTKLTLESFLLG